MKGPVNIPKRTLKKQTWSKILEITAHYFHTNLLTDPYRFVSQYSVCVLLVDVFVSDIYRAFLNYGRIQCSQQYKKRQNILVCEPRIRISTTTQPGLISIRNTFSQHAYMKPHIILLYRSSTINFNNTII